MKIAKDKNSIVITDPECFSVKDTLECGQVFRFGQSGGGYVLHASDKVCKITENGCEIKIITDDPDFFAAISRSTSIITRLTKNFARSPSLPTRRKQARAYVFFGRILSK